MARIINSPGVQITETDLSVIQQFGGGTNIFVAGFAPQGPTDEVLQVSTVSELEQIYGAPQTPAERYFYHSSKEILNSSANLLVTRLPYGSGSGEGFSSQYSALVYPVMSSGLGFTIGSPVQKNLSQTQYDTILQSGYTWSGINTTMPAGNIAGTTITGGIVVLNSAQTTINEKFEGYYVTITDNTGFGANTDFTAVSGFMSLSASESFYSVPPGRLGFALSATSGAAGTESVSEVIEFIPTYNFNDPYYRDSVVVSIFKVRNSFYEPQQLTFSLTEAFIGSLDSQKKTVANVGGTPRTFFIEDLVNNSSANVKVLVNPSLKNTNWTNLSSINPDKFVQTADSSKNVYPIGSFVPTYTTATNKEIGQTVDKIKRALTLIETPETVLVDVIADAGLSTIHAMSDPTTGTFSESTTISNDDLRSTSNVRVGRWRAVFNEFNNFVQNTRKDCMFISDPLRPIFVKGEDTKTLAVRSNTFSQNIYTPLKAHYESINSNYSAAYGNWLKVYDAFADKAVWTPSSGFVAAIYARNDAATQPWFAPAGFNRGTINNIVDIAFSPNQKQRDFLYTISINPIALFSGDGFVVFGQKTLQNKPSAFDRVNVRRLFLTLERATQRTLKYFVFEPNTDFTRTRLRNTIAPIFELARNTQGLYDYLIVCDERNNSPDLIDRNELAVDIYIKPTRAAEFILVNFIATRTSQNFLELI
jgi:hypothetical protein